MYSFAQIVFWIAFAALIYVYAGYPFALTVVSLLFRRRRPESGHTPSISMLIAAYNEEAGILKKLEQTVALDYPADKLEIMVLSDGSTDQTDAMVESFRDSRVCLLRVKDRKGKTNAQNEGVKSANGEILVFSDATTVYHPRALQYLACNYADPKVGAVSGRYQYFDPLGNSPTGMGTMAFWNYENLIKMAQSRIRTISGCCGCIYSVRRDLYTALSPDVISDLVQPLHVIRQDHVVVFEDRALAYEETTKSSSDEFSMRVRVVTRGIHGLLSVPKLLQPWRYPWVAFQLWSHKILRWLVPFFLVMLLGANVFLWESPAYRYFLFAQAGFYLMALLSLVIPIHRRWRVFGIPLYFCVLNTAALVSVIEVLRGKKYTVWQTVRT
jgi:glycosyltransferase involved in cell wall biosynthesis